MGYSKDELLDRLIECYEEHGHTKTVLLNNPNNDYPSQVTYYNHFGTMADARKAAGLYGGHTRNAVLESIEKCFDKHNRVTTTLLNEDDELLNSSALYAHFETISDAIQASDINRDIDEVRSKYTEEELLEELIICKDNEGDTKTRTINNRNGPSSQTYINKFGSIQRARELAGITCEFNTTYSDTTDEWIRGTQYDEDADAHIYVLSMYVDGEKSYYVGESKCVKKRIQHHLERYRFRTTVKTQYGERIATRDETNRVNDVEIVDIEYIIPLYKKRGESKIDFRRRIKFKEHNEYLSVAIDKNTTKVYGGR